MKLHKIKYWCPMTCSERIKIYPLENATSLTLKRFVLVWCQVSLFCIYFAMSGGSINVTDSGMSMPIIDINCTFTMHNYTIFQGAWAQCHWHWLVDATYQLQLLLVAVLARLLFFNLPSMSPAVLTCLLIVWQRVDFNLRICNSTMAQEMQCHWHWHHWSLIVAVLTCSLIVDLKLRICNSVFVQEVQRHWSWQHWSWSLIAA